MAAKEEFEVRYIKRMTEQTLDISTVAGKQDFVRNLVAYNVILEGIWFYSGFMVALWRREQADRLLLVVVSALFLSIGASRAVPPRSNVPRSKRFATTAGIWPWGPCLRSTGT